LGRFMGRVLEIRWPDQAFVRLGVLLAPLMIPFALVLYFFRLVPSVLGLPVHGKFYKLTNRRVLELRNEINFQSDESGRNRLRFRYGVETKSVPLDRFNSIEVVRRPGQSWYDAGDLIFRDGDRETFRLDAVARPESFRQNCLKAHFAYVGVKQARSRELAAK
jgi:hypothetical protein